jgi:endoglucanase
MPAKPFKSKLNSAQRAEREKFLLEITSLPTAAGREDAVIARVEEWVSERAASLMLGRDRCGNLVITGRGFKKACAKKAPLFITAHLDHPAFLVRSVKGADVTLEFRGGVQDAYFKGSPIEIFDLALKRSVAARVLSLDGAAKPFKTVVARLSAPASAAFVEPGCIGRWKFPKAAVVKGLVRTHACDDLASVAAALLAFDTISRDPKLAHAALLFTRAEEVGFVGAIGAARGGTIPNGSRLVCLECSRSFPHDSPIGAGPIVRVGDRLSVFTPELTNAVSSLAEAHSKAVPAFKFQRKLMAGGACEATAFASYGINSTCICLPLGNYHNMADVDAVLAGKKRGVPGPEFVSAEDFHGMIELLEAVARGLDAPGPSRRDMMEKIWAQHAGIVGCKA